MTRGIDAAAAGMVGIVNWNDIIANNLANINTPGFKQTLASFKNVSDLEVNQINSSAQFNSTKIGILSAGSVLDSTVFDFSQGSLKTTGNQTDLAISGEGFFVVRTPDGDAYTRNGSFIKRNDGVIATLEGYPLIGETGRPINANVNEFKNQEIKVLKDGSVEINKIIIDKIRIADFQDKKTLQAIGNSLFKPIENQLPVKANNYEINQGALEMANSNAIESMVNSIQGMRTYESLVKVVETGHRTIGKAVNELGRLRR